MDEIEKLNSYVEMRNKGTITEEEFLMLKKQLLGDAAETVSADPQPVYTPQQPVYTPQQPEPQPQAQQYYAQPQPEQQTVPPAYAAEAAGQKNGGFLSKLSTGAKIGLVVGLIALVLLVVLLGKGGKSPEEKIVVGTWNCHSVMLSGSSYTASDLGLTDDYITFNKDGTFKMNIGDNDRSGTWEYSETRTTGDTVFYFYPLTLSDGDEWLALYNVDSETNKELITLFVQSTLDSNNFILYTK